MKMAGKATALMLAMTLAAVGIVTVYGDPRASDNGVVGSTGGSTNMTLTGNVQIATLSATMLTTVAFGVDMTKVPMKSATDKVGANVWVTGPQKKDYKITDSSASTVWVYATAVTLSATSIGKTSKLVSKYSSLKAADYNLLFTIKDTKVAPPKVNVYANEIDLILDSDRPDFWMKSGTASEDKCYPNNDNGELLVLGQATDRKKNEMPLAIYVFTKKGWVTGDSLTVQSTFAVSVKGPNPAP